MSFVTALTDKLYAFMICRSKSTTELILETEPRSIGKITAGRQMVEGKINLAGQFIQQTDEVWNYKTNEKDKIIPEAWVLASGDIRITPASSNEKDGLDGFYICYLQKKPNKT